jgi:hypothetical protein
LPKIKSKASLQADTSKGAGLTAAYGIILKPEKLSTADCGVAQGMSTSGGGSCLLPLDQAAEPVKHLSFPPLLVPEVSPATIRSSTGSGFFGSSTPTSSSFVGVGAELAHPFFPSPLPIDLGEKIRSSPHVVEFQALLVLLSEG